MYNSKSDRRLRWSGGKIVSEGTKSRGQWGMDSDAYGRLYYNSNSVWFFTDSDDAEYKEKTHNHLINTGCSASHNR